MQIKKEENKKRSTKESPGNQKQATNKYGQVWTRKRKGTTGTGDGTGDK
jgi:hypothetical protein